MGNLRRRGGWSAIAALVLGGVLVLQPAYGQGRGGGGGGMSKGGGGGGGCQGGGGKSQGSSQMTTAGRSAAGGAGQQANAADIPNNAMLAALVQQQAMLQQSLARVNALLATQQQNAPLFAAQVQQGNPVVLELLRRQAELNAALQQLATLRSGGQ